MNLLLLSAFYYSLALVAGVLQTTAPIIFVSNYRYGTVVALGLDLTLRSRFPGKTLDDFMRAAWRTYGKTETPYVLSDLEGSSHRSDR